MDKVLRKVEQKLYLTKEGLWELMKRYRTYDEIADIVNANPVTVAKRCRRFGLFAWPRVKKKANKKSPQGCL